MAPAFSFKIAAEHDSKGPKSRFGIMLQQYGEESCRENRD
jgi:hypothetical protein